MMSPAAHNPRGTMEAMSNRQYVHGYTPHENRRLQESALALRDLLHEGVYFKPGSHVLEAGCGVGAQTVTLCANSPAADFTAVDRDPFFLNTAARNARELGLPNARFVRADLLGLPFAPASVDHVFVCYVLEHLHDPAAALRGLATLLRPGGSLVATEGDHRSATFWPETPEALAVWECLPEVQRRLGGDGHIGRRLHHLLTDGGLQNVAVRPLFVYCDPTRPELMRGFVDQTICGMLRGVERHAVDMGLVDGDTWRQGMADLMRIVHDPEGVFTYTFYRATGIR
jgi:SAM-dependent methyltransferase